MSPKAISTPALCLVIAFLTASTTAEGASAQGGDAAFDAIVDGVAARPHEDSCRLMQAWVDAHPHVTAAAQGLLWIARLRMLDGRSELARAAYERVRADWPNTPWQLHASKGIADLDLAAHRYGAAIEAYDELSRQPDAFWSNLAGNALHEARADRLRFVTAVLLALTMLGLGVARVVFARRAASGVWRVPLEVVIAVPVVGFMLFAAEQQPPAEAQATVTLALGGLAVLWTTAVHLRSRVMRPSHRVLETGLAFLQSMALTYCSIEMSGLWLKLVHTVMMREVD